MCYCENGLHLCYTVHCTVNIRQVDLNDFGFPEDELDEYYENCYDDPACVFRELVSEDNIDLPKPSFDDRWYPSIDEDDFNQYLSDRLYDI